MNACYRILTIVSGGHRFRPHFLPISTMPLHLNQTYTLDCTQVILLTSKISFPLTEIDIVKCALTSGVTTLLSLCLSSDWVFGSRRVTNCNNTEINCISNNMSEMSELGERPRLVEMSDIFLNHTNTLGSNRPEETVVTIDETLQQQPPDTHSGT